MEGGASRARLAGHAHPRRLHPADKAASRGASRQVRATGHGPAPAGPGQRASAPADSSYPAQTAHPGTSPDTDIRRPRADIEGVSMQYKTTTPHHRPQPGTGHSHLVVFRDQSAGLRYLTRSERTSEHTTTW